MHASVPEESEKFPLFQNSIFSSLLSLVQFLGLSLYNPVPLTPALQSPAVVGTRDAISSALKGQRRFPRRDCLVAFMPRLTSRTVRGYDLGTTPKPQV